MISLCICLCIISIFAKLNWLVKYHLKVFEINNEPFKEKYLLNNSPTDTHTWKRYDCGNRIALNWEKARLGDLPLFLQISGTLNGKVRIWLTPLVLGGADLQGHDSRGHVGMNMLPLLPTRPAFSLWAANNRKGARKEKETGVEIRIFILRLSGHDICFLRKKKKEILWWKRKTALVWTRLVTF